MPAFHYFKSCFSKEKRGRGRKGKQRRGKLPIYRNMATLKFFIVQLRTVQVTALIFSKNVLLAKIVYFSKRETGRGDIFAASEMVFLCFKA